MECSLRFLQPTHSQNPRKSMLKARTHDKLKEAVKIALYSVSAYFIAS
jgi:hypothetical protein